ncbi:MAG TPA: energy transducer TonB, partial [Paludibacter sp.]
IKFTSPVAEKKQAADEKTFTIVEQMPQYPGGISALMNYLTKNIKYPVDAQKNKEQGKVYVRFIVNAQGKVEKSEVIRSVSSSLDQEALRVVNAMPEWIPGKQNGKNVSVYYTLPINFAVQGKSSNSKVPENKNETFTVVEKLPQFPGGETELLKYIGDNLKYPVKAMEKRIQGRIIIRFIVNKSGKVETAEVLRSLDPECDKEALRVVYAMPDWTPGEQKGEKVAVYYTLPITFKIG